MRLTVVMSLLSMNMVNVNQNTNSGLKSKMAVLFPIPSGIIFLAGLVLAWGVLNIFGALKPTSFYSFSNIASVIESFGASTQPEAEPTGASGDTPTTAGENSSDDESTVNAGNPLSTAGQNGSTTTDKTDSKPLAAEPAQHTGGVAPTKKPAVTPAPATPPKNTTTTGTLSTATVVNAVPTAGPKTEKTFVYYSTGPTPSDPNGAIDLEARILEVGVVDKDTNVFTASSSPSANLRIAVKFDVINKGTKTSGSWSFNAVLPTLPLYIYSGDSQLPLQPGDRIEFIIGFDSVERKKDDEFIVNVDPSNSVTESNKSNNIVKTIIHPYYQ